MTSSLHPTDGARLLLERVAIEEDGSVARYDASVFTPDERFTLRARLAMDGSAELEAVGTPPPEELQTRLANLAKSTARAAKRKRDDDLPPWPPRILRWRGPGRG